MSEPQLCSLHQFFPFVECSGCAAQQEREMKFGQKQKWCWNESLPANPSTHIFARVPLDTSGKILLQIHVQGEGAWLHLEEKSFHTSFQKQHLSCRLRGILAASVTSVFACEVETVYFQNFTRFEISSQNVSRKDLKSHVHHFDVYSIGVNKYRY